MSSLFLRTLREDPADAEVPSHKLLVRAGYVRRVAPGGLLLAAAGAAGAAQRRAGRARGDGRHRRPGDPVPRAAAPRALRGDGRWTEYGANIFRLKDRKGADYLLGPTHEELFTLTVKGEYTSYKDYPVILYQIQTKYRDEERPRAGILRGREFLMKDSYSFDLTDEGLAESYRQAPRRLHQDLRPARAAVRDRLGDVGRDGRLGVARSSSPSRETGEDTFVRSPGRLRGERRGRDHARAPRAVRSRTSPPRRCTTRRTRRRSRRWSTSSTAPGLGRTFTAADTLKNVLVKTRAPGADELGAAGRRRARRPRGRHEAAGGGARARPRSRCWRRPTSPRTRSWSRATSARARWPRTACATSSTPGSSRARPG